MLLNDVDFVVASGLSHPAQYQAIVQATRQRGAVVVPAFEPASALSNQEGRRLALETVQLEGGPIGSTASCSGNAIASTFMAAFVG